MNPIYLVVGVPGSGKSWCCEQLRDKFEYVHHDGYIYLKQPGAYVKAILDVALRATKPLLCEAPFSVSETVTPLQGAGYKVTPVFIVENPEILAARYMKRENKPIPKGHLTRMQTYLKRAIEGTHFYGTSSEVLEYLRGI